MTSRNRNSTKVRSPSTGKKHVPAGKAHKSRRPELPPDDDEWQSIDDLEPPVWTAEDLVAPPVQRAADGTTILQTYTAKDVRRAIDPDDPGSYAYGWAAIPPAQRLSNGKCASCGRLVCRELLSCRGASVEEFIAADEVGAARMRKSIREDRLARGWENIDLPSMERRRELEAQMEEFRKEVQNTVYDADGNPVEEERPMGNGEDKDNLYNLGKERAKREEEKAKRSGKANPNPDPNPIKEKLKDKKLHLATAEMFFKIMDKEGDDLKMVLDSKGVETMWRYDHKTTLWSVVLDKVTFLERKLQKAITAVGARHKTSIKLLAEARKLVTTDPRLDPVHITFDEHGMVPVKNTLIDPTVSPPKVRDICKEDYCTWTLNIIYDPTAKCPWWLRMLADTFGDRTKEDRKANTDLLQNYLGASLIDNKNKALRRAMIFIGDTNSGKSALLDVASGMITDNPITTPIADLATGNHGTQSFIRRAPWILHEAFDQSAWNISSKAKLILGGNVFEVNPKGEKAISVCFTAPAIWATNHEPKFRESTRAMITRMILMRFSNAFDPENEIGTAVEARKHGYQEPQKFVLATEKSGILNWMLIGAKRAMKDGFKDTAEGKEALHDIRLDSNLAAGFVEECIDFDPGIRMSVPDFNAGFMSWWKENRGDDHTVSPDQIGRALKALSHAKIALDRHKFKDDKGLRFICGVKFNDAGKAHWENKTDEMSTPNYGRKGDLARVSTSIKHVHTQIPPGKNWLDHPLVVKLRTNAAKEKTGTKL